VGDLISNVSDLALTVADGTMQQVDWASLPLSRRL